MKNAFAVVMDEERNPLRELPPAQKFQLMTLLSGMWVSLFCLTIGAWFLWDELFIGHVALAIGITLTALTFRSAEASKTAGDQPAGDKC